jgi:hypothetical protein
MRLRLAVALLGASAGVVAVVIAILLLQRALS